MNLSESDIESKVVAFCRLRGMLTYKFVSPSNRGVPDRIVIAVDGRIMFLEIKRAGNKPTDLQLHEMLKMKNHGCRVEWGDNWDYLKETLEKFHAPQA